MLNLQWCRIMSFSGPKKSFTTHFKHMKLLDWKLHSNSKKRKIKASPQNGLHFWSNSNAIHIHHLINGDLEYFSFKMQQVYSTTLRAANSSKHLRLRYRIIDNVWWDSSDSKSKHVSFITGVAESYDVIFSWAPIISSGLH